MASPTLVVTQGDPSGIGVEITLSAWMRRNAQSAPFFLLADPDHVTRTARSLALDAPVRVVEPAEAAHAFQHALPVVPLSRSVRGVPGRPAAEDAAMTIEAIERGVAMVHEGSAAGVVTNPITKDVLYKVGFRHPGHTEFLGELTQRFYAQDAQPVMMLWCAQLAVVPVTIHIPLARVFTELTEDLIVATARIVARDLKAKFGLMRPRLAVSGLNPHAGENGAMGREEIDVIRPAVARLQNEGIDVVGPLSADTMFHEAARTRYDAALCMYHDQALIPIKTLAFDSGVNLTLGLPFIRTSPDHGAAYDIAGQGKARCESLIAALDLADRLSKRAQ